MTAPRVLAAAGTSSRGKGRRVQHRGGGKSGSDSGKRKEVRYWELTALDQMVTWRRAAVRKTSGIACQPGQKRQRGGCADCAEAHTHKRRRCSRLGCWDVGRLIDRRAYL